MDVNNCTYFYSTNCKILIGKNIKKHIKKVKNEIKIPFFNCLKIFQKKCDSDVIEEVCSKITTTHYKDKEATYDENNNLVAWNDEENEEDFQISYEVENIETSSKSELNRDSAYFSSNDTPTKIYYCEKENFSKLNFSKNADDKNLYPNKKFSCSSRTLADYVTRSDVARVSQESKVVSICEKIPVKNTNNRQQGEIRIGCEISANLSIKCLNGFSFFSPDKIFSFHSLTIDQISALMLNLHQALTRQIQTLSFGDFSSLISFTSALITYLERETNIVFMRGVDLEGLIDRYNGDEGRASSELRKIFIDLWINILLFD